MKSSVDSAYMRTLPFSYSYVDSPQTWALVGFLVLKTCSNSRLAGSVGVISPLKQNTNPLSRKRGLSQCANVLIRCWERHPFCNLAVREPRFGEFTES